MGPGRNREPEEGRRIPPPPECGIQGSGTPLARAEAPGPEMGVSTAAYLLRYTARIMSFAAAFALVALGAARIAAYERGPAPITEALCRGVPTAAVYDWIDGRWIYPCG